MSQKRFVSRRRVYSAVGILLLVLCAWSVGVQGDALNTGGPRGSGIVSVLLQDHTSVTDPMAAQEAIAQSVVVTGNGVDTGSVAAVAVDGDAELGTADSMTFVYTPPTYDPRSSTRYPVVYLLHGTPGQSSDWFVGASLADRLDQLINDGTIPPVIAVSPEISTPEVSDTRCLDSTTGGPLIDTYLTKHVVPWVDETYHTYADADHRVLMGFSMGAFCATNLLFQHQDMFSSAAAMADYGEPGPDAAPLLADDDEYAQQSPAGYLADPYFEVRKELRFYLTVGGQSPDVDVEDTPLLADLAAERGVTVVYEPDDEADHDWQMVSDHVGNALEMLLDRRAR
ncbi:alpha/beta hydrolase [Actinomyces israelii]|uniref:alpha/beta hydrolase n=1 Tax=Actinomyces israelii TaxID=1659 RepID=UPI0023525D6B|nr:alpha/beta hydrolase-fold protein [Actinomyces israelii]